jgi:nitrate reductase gamma subunit
MGTMIFQVILCVALFFFLCGSVIRIARYAKMPPHLRWELYPAGSTKGGSDGSYLEHQEWWNKPWHQSRISELRFMAKEIFLFHKCRMNNRGIWRFTLPFHWGLFLLTGWLLIQFAGSGGAFFLKVLGRTAPFVDGAVLVASPLAMAGLVLAAYGCTGLLLKRLLDPALRSVTSRSDFFGLFLILATVLCWFLSWALFDRSLAGATGYLRELTRFAPASDANPFMISGIVLLSVFLVYMPFTYMVHAYAKYFIYHKVLWQDEPMAPGSETERRVEQMLRRPVGWSASHVSDGGSWGKTISSSP